MHFRAFVGNLDVKAGRGDDVLRGSNGWLEMFDGGPGDDRLHGGRGHDILTGGPGRDWLFGGPANDDLVEGEADAQAAVDIIDGGRSDCPGVGDTLDYRRRTAPVRLALGRQTSTEDVLRGIESVRGGSGDDHLTGDDCGNLLNGGPGDDVIHGLGRRDIVYGFTGDDHVYGDDGDDFVSGNSGSDRLFGGDGDDRLNGDDLVEQGGTTVRLETPDTVSCGNGDDDASSGDSKDDFESDCELTPVFGAAPSRMQADVLAPPMPLLFQSLRQPFRGL